MIMTNNPIGSRIQDFDVRNKIGSGGFATVFKAKCLQPGYEHMYVAIKKIDKKEITKKNLRKRVDLEIHIHSNLNHLNIVKFYTSFEDKNFVYLILELCEQGSLEEYLKKNGPFSEKDACQIIRKIIDGVRYLHSKYILHRDLSLKNILVTNNMDIRIADFGMAAELSHPDEKKFTMLGTANFISPEVVRKKSYDYKADCWSVGCILYALLYGKPPFDGKEKKYFEIMNDAVMCPLNFPNYASNEAKELLSDLLNKDPKSRVNINATLDYAFFKKYEETFVKKSEFYSSKNSDSGMSSLFGSTGSSSRSGHRKMGNCENSSNFCMTDSRNGNLRHSSSVPIDLQIISSDYCESTCNNHVRCNSALEQKIIRENRYQSQLSSNCFKMRNKIETLPSRKEIFELKPSTIVNPLFANSRQYVEPSERYKGGGHSSERHNFPHQFYSSEQSESQIDDVQIRSCAKMPLPYPSHRFQNISEDYRLCSSSYSGYVENSLPNGNLCRYDNNLPYSNTQEHDHRNPTCSHEYYCAPEITCSHEIICSCHQNYNPVRGSRNNSLVTQNSCEKENNHHVELTLERKVDFNKTLKDIIEPLTTTRLLPKRHTTNNAIVSILQNGMVCLEFLKMKKTKKIITSVCFISSDGLTIELFKPKKNTMPSDDSPPLPNSSRDVKYFSFDNLPEKHWKKYQWAKKFVDIVRAQTPKVTIYGEDAKCVMMENGPNPDFEIQFFNGCQIMEAGSKMTLTDQNGKRSLIYEDSMNTEYKVMLNTFLSMKELCKQYEAYSEKLCEVNNKVKPFPIIVGRRPNISLKFQDMNKENSSPQSIHSSAINRAINAMTSYDGTINSVNSPSQNSFRNAMQSLTTTERNIPKLFRNIKDILPSLKCFPKIENEKILTEYKDGIQMWSSKDGEDVYFYDTKARKRVINIKQNEELKKRAQDDLPGILFYILSDRK